MTKDDEDALRCADALQRCDCIDFDGDFTASAAHLRRLVQENEALRLDAGSLRLCLTCGRAKPSDEPQHDPANDCDADPDMGHLCSFDATPQEAWQHWSRLAHERASEIAGLVRENEAKDALLRQAVQELEWSGYRGALVAAIRQHLEGRA